eukprot:9926736-Alexandrium_andersonii.AAC.1
MSSRRSSCTTACAGGAHYRDGRRSVLRRAAAPRAPPHPKIDTRLSLGCTIDGYGRMPKNV